MLFEKLFKKKSRFKPLPDYPGYAVSKDGEVRNIFTDHILKPLTGRSGKERKRVKLNGKFVYIDELVEQVHGKGKTK